MVQQKRCAFHQALNIVSYGFGIGLCDLGGKETVCEGDIRYCEKAEAMISALFQEDPKQNTRKTAKARQRVDTASA